VKTIQNPQTKKQAQFAKAREACRKDIEKAFGVLQDRFAIVRDPAYFGDKKTLNNIMKCCVILHNIVIEDERVLDLEFFFNNVGSLYNLKETLIAFKFFLRRIGRLKMQMLIPSPTLISSWQKLMSPWFI
jgi:hypothetical protein